MQCIVVIFLCLVWPLLLEARGEAQLVRVPAGSFVPLFPDREGAKNELFKPVLVDGFAIQTNPVTTEEFMKFVQTHVEWSRDGVNSLFANEVYLNQLQKDGEIPAAILRAPVTHVSWFAADAYCRSVGLRLPTTNEWEYVADFPLVADGEHISEAEKTKKILEWYAEPSSSNKQDFEKTISMNSLGVAGQFGLVWEWTHDFNSVLMTRDNRANSDLKNGLFCGGGTIGSSNPEDYARFMRYAHRSSLTGRYSAGNLGFRCAK